MTHHSSLTLCAAATLLLVACGVPESDTAETRVPSVSGVDSLLATDDVAYLSRLGLIRGHLLVGMELYEKGMHDHARGHMKHPADELYAALVQAFEHRGSSGFAVELETLASLVQQDADDSAVRQAYAALLERIAASEARVDLRTAGAAATQGAVAVNLLREAAGEYSIGVVNGSIEEVHEYQDAYGFTRVANDYARRALAAQPRGGALGDKVRDIEKLIDLWPTLAPTVTVDGDARHIEAVASEFAAELQR
jgi:hypothetical protein